jgi:hypothetical protein
VNQRGVNRADRRSNLLKTFDRQGSHLCADPHRPPNQARALYPCTKRPRTVVSTKRSQRQITRRYPLGRARSGKDHRREEAVHQPPRYTRESQLLKPQGVRHGQQGTARQSREKEAKEGKAQTARPNVLILATHLRLQERPWQEGLINHATVRGVYLPGAARTGGKMRSACTA